MEVYDRAVRTVPQELRLQIYDLYLARASDFFGIAKVGQETSVASHMSRFLVQLRATICVWSGAGDI